MLQAIEDRLLNTVVPKLGLSSYPNAPALVSQADGGMPPQPYQGQVYFGVHGGRSSVKSNVGAYYLDETYNFKITITVKSARVPHYKWGDVVCAGAEPSLHYLTHLVKASLHGYIELAGDANKLLLAEHPDQEIFIAGEPPLMTNSQEPIPRDGRWFGASLDSRGTQAISPTYMGMSQTSEYLGLHIIYKIHNLQGLLS